MQKTFLTLTAAVLMAASGCSKKEEKEAEPIAPVRIAAVEQGSIRRVVTADAVLYPQDQASIMPKISAPVRKFFVNRGDHVKEGQLLAELESRDLAAASLESKGLFNQAEANYRTTTAASVPEAVVKAQLDVEAAKQALAASQKLVESREKLFKDGALARKLVDEAQVAYSQAHSQFETAREHLRALESVGKQEQIKAAAAQVESAKAHFQASEAQVSYAAVRSPISGVVTDRPVYAGEMANAGAPLVTVMDVARVVARANIPQNEAAQLKVGQAATITQADGGLEVPGKVIVVSPAVDAASTTIQVWVQAANPGERLRPGTAVRVSIVAETIANALVVPKEAILPGSEGGTSVMVVGADSVAHEKKVEAGVRDAGKAQILRGVAAGENVVTVGGLGLPDGGKVRVLKPGEKAGEGKEEKDDSK